MSVDAWSNIDLIGLLWLEDISNDEEFDEGESWSVSSLRDRVLESIDELDYLIQIDRSKSLLTLTTRERELIWTIWKGSYEKGKIYKKAHLFKKIEKKFRWKGYGTALMQEYIDAWFEIPEFEVTWIYETYVLLWKFWYMFHSVLNPNTWEEWSPDFIPNELQIKQLIKKWYIIKLLNNDD